MHGVFTQPVASIKALLSDSDVFEKSQKVSKNGQEIRTLTFLKSITFLLAKFGRKRLHRRASLKSLF